MVTFLDRKTDRNMDTFLTEKLCEKLSGNKQKNRGENEHIFNFIAMEDTCL